MSNKSVDTRHIPLDEMRAMFGGGVEVFGPDPEFNSGIQSALRNWAALGNAPNANEVAHRFKGRGAKE